MRSHPPLYCMREVQGDGVKCPGLLRVLAAEQNILAVWTQILMLLLAWEVMQLSSASA